MALGYGWAVRRALRVGLAHHPLCSHFAADVYRVGPLHLCRGCALAWPMFLAGSGLALWLVGLGASSWWLGAIGLVLGAGQVTGVAVRGSAGWRAGVKVVGGLGLGLVLVALVHLPLGIAPRVVLLFAMAAAFVGLQTVRALRIVAACRRCPWAMDWDACPGFGGIWEPFSKAPGVLAPGR